MQPRLIMDIFDFENRLKDYTTNSRGKVDMDRLLNDLDIKKSSRFKFGYKYFLFAGLALAGIAFFTYSFAFDDNQTSQLNAEVAEVVTVPTLDDKEKNTILNKTTISEEKTTITLNNNTETNTNKTLASPQTKSSSSSRNIAVKNETYKSVAPANAVSNRNRIPSAAPSNFNSEVTNTAAPSESKLIPTNNNNATAPVLSKIIAAANKNIRTSTPIVESTTLTNRFSEPVALLPTSNIVSLISLEDKILDKRGSSCPQFSERLWHMYIIPEVGYTFPMKTLSLTDEDFRFIFTERLAHESTIEGINASLFLQFKNQITGLYVKPGVSYSRFTERIDFVNRQIDFDTTTVTTIEGGMEITEEVITENERITRSLVHYQLHEFELPVALGYSLNFNQFAIDIEAGIRLNFLQRATGQILTNEGDFIDVGNENVDLFKNSVGLGFFGGVLFKRQLNRRTELYIAPRFSFNTLSYSSNSNPITQRYNVAGLHAGLIYAIH